MMKTCIQSSLEALDIVLKRQLPKLRLISFESSKHNSYTMYNKSDNVRLMLCTFCCLTLEFVYLKLKNKFHDNK